MTNIEDIVRWEPASLNSKWQLCLNLWYRWRKMIRRSVKAMNFSVNLKELRCMNGLLQRDIAEKLGCTTQCYCNYEKGKTEPDLHTPLHACRYVWRNPWSPSRTRERLRRDRKSSWSQRQSDHLREGAQAGSAQKGYAQRLSWLPDQDGSKGPERAKGAKVSFSVLILVDFVWISPSLKRGIFFLLCACEVTTPLKTFIWNRCWHRIKDAVKENGERSCRKHRKTPYSAKKKSRIFSGQSVFVKNKNLSVRIDWQKVQTVP